MALQIALQVEVRQPLARIREPVTRIFYQWERRQLP